MLKIRRRKYSRLERYVNKELWIYFYFDDNPFTKIEIYHDTIELKIFYDNNSGNEIDYSISHAGYAVTGIRKTINKWY